PNDRLFAGLGDHRQLHASLLNIENSIGRVALRVDRRAAPVVHDFCCHSRRAEEGLRVEHASDLRQYSIPITLSGGCGPFRRDICGAARAAQFPTAGMLLQSCRTTLSNERLTLSGRSPLYSMKPSFVNLFRET